MHEPPSASRSSHALAEELRSSLRGDTRFDPLYRAVYATDASIYEIVPLGVVLPKDHNDVVTVVNACRARGTSIIPRGAGTGLAGGAVGPGVQLDMSRYMNQLGPLDLEAQTVEVEPGVVLDELNAHLAPHGLQFAPDVATSSRATIGGMIANNSCGAHSIIYGRTVDHILGLTVVLADGSVVTFGPRQNSPHADSGATEIECGLGRIRDQYHAEIVRRFPNHPRSNAGYGLDRLGPPGGRAEAIKILCGSEGTLGIIVRATLRLLPVPRHKGLVVLHFDEVLDALDATPAILQHDPAAVELIDRLILDAARANPAIAKRCDFLQGDPSALLLVEFLDDDAESLSSRMDKLSDDADARGSSFAACKLIEPEQQTDLWNLRKSGLGLLMSKPGDAQPYAFVEDTAVDPGRLREYIQRFTEITRREGVFTKAGCYAHAGAGCIHVRPVLNLKKADDVQRMGRIAEAVSDLALEFGGTVTGEHGDGILRSCRLKRMYGAKITAAFKEVKNLFDPPGIFNPHKIVDPKPMTEHLRYGPDFETKQVKTHLDFSAHGGLTALAAMCNGLGQCRQRLVGTMCPSYAATGDELHTTRARANALRIALSNRDLLSGFDDPQLAEVMDLCISCKACKSECPTGVDMARMKTEYLSRKNLVQGVSPRSRFIADMPGRLASASRFPRLSNLILRSRLARGVIERRFGLDRRIPPARLARQTFRMWFRQHVRERAAGFSSRGVTNSGESARPKARGSHTLVRKSAQVRESRLAPPPCGTVIYFVDCWTNYFTPQVGIAAVTLLERAGFKVYCPRTFCCQRPAISRGLLTEAKQIAEANVQILARVAGPAWQASSLVPIVGTEPSCILTLLDEYPQLVRTNAARRIAAQAVMIETFLQRVLTEHPGALQFSPREVPLRYHAHCHQKALIGSADAMALLGQAWGDQTSPPAPSGGSPVSEIDSGCCGMAGSFGHEVEHYEIARAIGEQRLFPAVRDRGDAEIAVSGFSCRQHIEHHTGVPARHIIEHLADALA